MVRQESIQLKTYLFTGVSDLCSTYANVKEHPTNLYYSLGELQRRLIYMSSNQYFPLDFFLYYNGLHLLATPPPWQDSSRDDMLPISVGFRKQVEEPNNPRDRILLKFYMQQAEKLWQVSDVHHVLFNSLNSLKHTARITNIVCIGLGTLYMPGSKNANPAMQHIVASSIAQDLERVYKAEGFPVDTPITIIAQDPAYNELDRVILSELPVPIKTVSDPEGFLAINESSLVFSCYPGVPVKQLVADLSSEAPGGKGPAALFLNRNLIGKAHGDVNLVRYEREHPFRYADPLTHDYLRMLESYTQVFDGERLFGEDLYLFIPTLNTTHNETKHMPGYE
ncbi:unnamed protein product [Alternaria sp. RS040]